MPPKQYPKQQTRPLPKVDKIENLAADFARAAMAHGAYTVKTSEDLANYCLTAAKVISDYSEQQDDQG